MITFTYFSDDEGDGLMAREEERNLQYTFSGTPEDCNKAAAKLLTALGYVECSPSWESLDNAISNYRNA